MFQLPAPSTSEEADGGIKTPKSGKGAHVNKGLGGDEEEEDDDDDDKDEGKGKKRKKRKKDDGTPKKKRKVGFLLRYAMPSPFRD